MLRLYVSEEPVEIAVAEFWARAARIVLEFVQVNVIHVRLLTTLRIGLGRAVDIALCIGKLDVVELFQALLHCCMGGQAF